jgi:putative FmdB family regulatory protein
MPIYEFRCGDCGRVVEALRRIGEGPEGLTCPGCGSSRLDRQLSTFASRSSGPSGQTSAASSCGPSGFT